MESSLYIEGTSTTPTVKFEAAKGNLTISGRSISENAYQFYKPLFDSIERYVTKPLPTTIEIDLDYINTISSKCLLELLKKMEGLPAKGIKVRVNWYYRKGDHSMLEVGKDYEAVVKLDVKLVAK